MARNSGISQPLPNIAETSRITTRHSKAGRVKPVRRVVCSGLSLRKTAQGPAAGPLPGLVDILRDNGAGRNPFLQLIGALGQFNPSSVMLRTSWISL